MAKRIYLRCKSAIASQTLERLFVPACATIFTPRSNLWSNAFFSLSFICSLSLSPDTSSGCVLISLKAKLYWNECCYGWASQTAPRCKYNLCPQIQSCAPFCVPSDKINARSVNKLKTQDQRRHKIERIVYFVACLCYLSVHLMTLFFAVCVCVDARCNI